VEKEITKEEIAHNIKNP